MKKKIGNLIEITENIVFANKKPHEEGSEKNIETFISYGLVMSILLFIFSILLALIS